MSIECSTVVAVPRSEVFAWFGRPGAFARLAPPWQPASLVEEAESLADGRAVLGLPGGLRWVAQHEAAAYDPPSRFADRISRDGPASIPVAKALSWHHVHEFAEVDPTHTRVIDRVDTWVPEFALRPMFAYRYRQLADDLDAHGRAAERGFAAKTVAVTGSSGLIGSALTAFLTAGGHTVVRLVRHQPHGSDERRWNPDDPNPALLAGVDAVIHLAGESIAGRFTEEHKRAIRDSRVDPTRKLAELTARSGVPTFVSASAIGYYGNDRGDEVLTENAERGTGFLADVVADWEDAASEAATGTTRVVSVRTGIVQSPRGGVLRLLRPLFAAGLGGRIGAGRQWMPWIGIDDLVDIYHRALWDTELHGPVNAVAPNPVRNNDFTRALGKTLRRPTLLPVPAFGPELLLGGEGAQELATASQRVTPQRLLGSDHAFRAAELEPALRHVLGRARLE
ncbi:TIGR01777 family oxidoreductase [Nocardia callitridis]|uniref:TIGR01777 family oxidoreductase n=1 Tax=Nocardia callitridis TaxID=648753 RepID=A0ABP9K8B8_9NOCA